MFNNYKEKHSNFTEAKAGSVEPMLILCFDNCAIIITYDVNIRGTQVNSTWELCTIFATFL